MVEINVRSSAQMIRGLGGRGGRRAARSAAIIDGAFQAGRALKSAPAPARADLLNETNVKYVVGSLGAKKPKETRMSRRSTSSGGGGAAAGLAAARRMRSAAGTNQAFPHR